MLHRKIIGIFLFSMICYQTSGFAKTKLVQIIIDNSGMIHDEKDPRGKSGFDKFVLDFLNEIANKHRRERKDTTIRIASATEPPRQIWMGYASDFSRKGIKSADIRDLIKDKSGCNNIPIALVDAKDSKYLTQADINDLYIITSGVHSGPECEKLTQINYELLIRKIDKDFVESLKSITTEFDWLSIQYLTSTQRRLLFRELANNTHQRNLGVQGQGFILSSQD